MQKLKAYYIYVMFLLLSVEDILFISVVSNTANCKSGCYKNVCGCGTWSYVKIGSCWRVFRNGVLKTIFALKIQEVMGGRVYSSFLLGDS